MQQITNDHSAFEQPRIQFLDALAEFIEITFSISIFLDEFGRDAVQGIILLNGVGGFDEFGGCCYTFDGEQQQGKG